MQLNDIESLKVLLVDDSEATVKLLENLLKNAKFDTFSVFDGESCLENAKKFKPELILLDYNLPDIDGPKVCRQLKEDPKTKDIPVIFLTVSKGNSCLVKAFDAGASDYITKPFNFIELTTRIRTQVELKHAREKLTSLNNELELINGQKDEMLGVVSHDLKNPIAAIQSLAEILQMDNEWSPNEQEEVIENIRKSAVYMRGLVEELLDVNSITRGAISLKIDDFDWVDLAQSVINTNLSNATRKDQEIEFQCDSHSIPIVSDERVSFQIVDNLMSNAIKYSPPGKKIVVTLKEENNAITCSIKDNGPGLTEDDQKKLFTQFTKLSARPTAGESSTGLGLSIVKKLALALNGDVWCTSEIGHGSIFSVKVPKLSCDISLETNQFGPSRDQQAQVGEKVSSRL